MAFNQEKQENPEKQAKHEQQNIAEQAAEWQLLLDECPAEDLSEQIQKFNAWQQQDIRHAHAAERVALFLQQMSLFKKPAFVQTPNSQTSNTMV